MDGEVYQIAGALLIEVVKDQIKKFIKGYTVGTLNLPEITITDEKNQKIVTELGKTAKVISNKLNKEPELNNLIGSFAPIASKENFTKVVNIVFDDGLINWGRIFMLFYVVGKLAVKMLQSNLPNVVLDLVNWCLDYFKTTLLGWIRSMGGWISSISGLTQFSLERFSSSSLCRISPSAFVFTFMAGVLIGGLIAWKMNKNS